MSAITDLSEALGDAVAKAAGGIVAVHSGRCDVSSGVAWGEHHVVTAAHGVEPESELTVTVGGERVPASLTGIDPGSDLAVLHVERSLTPFRAADWSALRVGNLAIAVAEHARGTRARLGIVSRLGGEWRLGATRVDRYLETDIEPAPSLSGSALLDPEGGLLGLNATGIRRGALVTLPAATISRVVDAIVQHGRVRRAKLGVLLQSVELPSKSAETRGQARGLIVLGVSAGGPADRAGVLTGDVLVTIAGSRVGRVDELASALDETKIDNDVSLELVRAGQELTLSVRPEAR
jgi:S1-C subfamily serine protease